MLSTWSWWNVTLSTCLNSRERVWMSAQAGSRMMKSTRTWPLLLILMGMLVGLTPSRSRPSLSLEHDWTSTERTWERMLFWCYNPTNIFPNGEVLCDELVTRDGDTRVTSCHIIWLKAIPASEYWHGDNIADLTTDGLSGYLFCRILRKYCLEIFI